MLKIKLQRPFNNKISGFHIVVANSNSPRDGKFLEKLGTVFTKYPYEKQSSNTKKNYNLVRLNYNRTLYWLKKGAQPTDKIKKILKYL